MNILNIKLGLGIDIGKLDREIEEIEKEVEGGEEKKDIHKSIRNIKRKFGSDVSYIG